MFQVLISIIAAIWYIKQEQHLSQRYLELNSNTNINNYSKPFKIILLVGTWIQIVFNFVSPSLIITLEITKAIHGAVMALDILMYD